MSHVSGLTCFEKNMWDWMNSHSFLFCYSKTPMYKTPRVLKQSSSIQRPNVHIQTEEKMKLSFDCCEGEADSAMSVGAISPGEGENIEEKLQECLLQLETVSTCLLPLPPYTQPIYNKAPGQRYSWARLEKCLTVEWTWKQNPDLRNPNNDKTC